MGKMQFLRPDSAKQLILLKKPSSYFQMRMRQDAKRIFLSGYREWNAAQQRYAKCNEQTPERKRRKQLAQVNAENSII